MENLRVMEPVQVEQEQEQPEFKGRSLEMLKRMFRHSEEAHTQARILAHRDRDWYDNFDDSQWSDTEKATLQRRGQPVVTSNRIKRKINFLCGLEQRQRSDPRAFPRTPKHQEAAIAITDALDYIESATRFDNTASGAFRDLCVEGIEAAEIIFEDGEIVVNLIDFDSLFYDPRSKREDFGDAKYIGYGDWFDEEEAKEMFPEEDQVNIIEGSFEDDAGVNDQGYEDKPYGQWCDADRKRVRICCVYWRDSEGWKYTYFTGGGILSEGMSPYLDDKGQPECPIIAASAYMTRQNERYGVVRDMISPQSEMNFRRSSMLGLMKNKRMWERAKGILPADAKEVVARADGILTVNGALGTDWGFMDSTAEFTENAQMLQEAKQEIDVAGPNAAFQGRGTEQQSGRAIALQQNAGMAEENGLYDTHNDWKLRIYRSMWARIKQFWTEEKWVRVTDDNNSPRFVGFNVQVPVVDEQTGQPVIDPMTGQPKMKIENNPAEMDGDIILESAPDAITLQHEEFAKFTEMARSGVPIPPDLLIEASQLRNKGKLLERMNTEKQAQEKLQQAGQQIQQMQQVIEQMQKKLQDSQQTPLTPLEQAKVTETMARAQNIQAKTRSELMGQGEIAADIENTRADTATKIRQLQTPQF